MAFFEQVADNVLSNFAGIFTSRPSAKYSSGARCVLKINGRLVGFAFSISWKITTDQVEIRTIDDYLPYEIAPQKISVEGSIGMLHIPNQSATTLLIQPDQLAFLFHKYISIEVRDSKTDDLLFFTDKAVITSKSEDIRVDQLSNVNLTWRAIGWKDERKPGIVGIKEGDTPQGILSNLGSRLKSFLTF